MKRFANHGFPLTRAKCADVVQEILMLRKANEKAGRLHVKFSHSAKEFLRRRKNNPTEPCLSHEFWMRLEQEDNVRFSSVSSRPMSAQRRQNSTHANWQRLNDLRVDVCTRLGIYDPATGHLQTNRIFALDEAPNPMDGAAKGNNVEQVYGIYVVFSMPVFVFVFYSIQKLRNALRPKEYNLII